MSIPETISLEEITVVPRSPSPPLAGESLESPIGPPSAALAERIAVIGNYLPRLCAIATFTTDLCDALRAEDAAADLLALPINDSEEGYDYPGRVRFAMAENDLASYRKAADFINADEIDLVCLQHEYGIFEGNAGGHTLELLPHLEVPLV